MNTQTPSTSAASATTFAALGAPDFVVAALARRGITEAFQIQAVTIADALAGRDVCGRAPTGSGKTLAFGVPLVARAAELPRCAPGRPVALVLAPTRELAEQITTELSSFSGRVRVEAVYGGVGYGRQIAALRRGVDILVACPGRLEDLIQRRDVSLTDVRLVVLDEADRMADMGFLPAVRRLLEQTQPDRQTVLFSATLDGDVAKVTRDYQRDPVRHEIGESTPDVRAATHLFWKLDRNDRTTLLAELVKVAWPAIIFTRTRHGADRLTKQLAKLGVGAAPIHGGLSQNARNRALDDFGKARVHALVATDVAARGIHVDGVAAVIHYDPPADHKDYVHRSGRTARAGADGVVVSLVSNDQAKDVRHLIRMVGLDADLVMPDLGAVAAADYGSSRNRRAPVARVAPAVSDERPARRPEHPRPDHQGRGQGDRRRPVEAGTERSGNRPAGESRSPSGRPARPARPNGGRRRSYSR
jgi:superfamily II DNA/RNA helicase